MGPWSSKTVVLTGRDIRPLSLSPPCQDTARRQPSTSQGESSHQKPALLASWSWIPSPQNCKKIKFCCLSYLCSVAQPCLTLCDPMDCSPPGSSVHGSSQARILEWVTISFSRGFFWPRDQTWVSCISCIGRQILYHWATWEAHLGCGILIWRPQLAKTGSIMDSWGEISAQAFKPVLILQPERAKLKRSLQCLACRGAPQKHIRVVLGQTEWRCVTAQSPGFWRALLSVTLNY